VVRRDRQHSRQPVLGRRPVRLSGKEATPQNGSSRLLLIGTRHGSNAALLVNAHDRTAQCRGLDSRNASRAPAWAPEAYTDNEGRRWNKLKVRELLADEAFMDIGA
jgi:twitching motility protein PilI